MTRNRGQCDRGQGLAGSYFNDLHENADGVSTKQAIMGDQTHQAAMEANVNNKANPESGTWVEMLIDGSKDVEGIDIPVIQRHPFALRKSCE